MERITDEFKSQGAAIPKESHENKNLLVERIYRHLTPNLSEKMLRRVFGDKRSDRKEASTITKADLFDLLRQQVFVKKPIGLLMARRIEGVVYISYSDLNEDANDVWDFKKAKLIASNRINEMFESKACLEDPYDYKDSKGREWTYEECDNVFLLDRHLDAFVDRCNLYFKDEKGMAYPVVCPFRLCRIINDVDDDSGRISIADGEDVAVETHS